MSDERAAKQAAMEERRRAARRAALLKSAGSRLDTICGIVNEPTPQTKPLSTSQGAHTNEQHRAHTSPSSTASVSPPSTPSPTSSDSSIAGQPTEKRNSSPKHTPTAEKAPQLPQTSIDSHQRRNASMIPSSSPSFSPTRAPASVKDKSTPQGFLSRKTGLLLGIVLATLLAICDFYFPDYWTFTLTSFVLLEILMWSRVSEPSDGGMLSLAGTLMPGFPSPSPQQPNAMNGLSRAISVGKAVLFTAQDWLIAQFVAVLLHNANHVLGL